MAVKARRERPFRRRHLVTALVAIVAVAAAIGVVSQRSEIGDLTTKNETLAAGKAQAIRQRDALQAALDADAVQKARDEAAASRLEAQRPLGATLFAVNCAGCHGVDGEGSIGPQLLRGAVASHLSEAEEVAVVTNGRGGMPAGGGGGPPGGVLSPEQIQQVVGYTRTH